MTNGTDGRDAEVYDDLFEYFPLQDGSFGVQSTRAVYLKKIEYPTTYKGKTVSTILPLSFWSCVDVSETGILCTIEEIVIPDTIQIIGLAAFWDCKQLTSIFYQGTIAQWNDIYKESLWDKNTGDYTVYCTDGNIAKGE